VDHLVLPVLEDWKPDLIINSAGQDNHFSDPITDMAVTAQGYAALTRKLKAHVAVLEGGYSVQSALPYVNMGILLAMAGLDTSRVVEPDYQPDAFCQSERTHEYVKRLSEILFDRYRRREELGAQVFRGKTHHEENRSVFYDGDGINERQKERVRVCEECAGVVILESAVGKRDSLLAVDLPRRCCPACRDEGENAYRKAATDDFGLVLLRDRPSDTVLRRSRQRL
jgi:hypothetical protein